MEKQLTEVATEWKPRQTWVFAVGDWPAETRRDTALIDAFRALGVPEGNIVFLAYSGTRARTEEQMALHFKQAGPGDLAIFYFTGYSGQDGDEANFVLTDERWPVRRIFERIEKHFTGSQALLLADTAHAGGLATEMERRRTKRIKYAVLASSVPGGCSTGTWIYTNSLIEALEGAAGDANGDGFVSLLDVAAYVEQQMAADAAKMPTFAATPGFPVGLCLAPVKARPGRVGEYVEACDQWGGWVPARIDDEREGEFYVRFCNYLTNPRSWVPASQVRPLSLRKIPLGEQVQVISSDWTIGTVIDARAGLYLVHYDDEPARPDEWVGSHHIRRPSFLSALFPHPGTVGTTTAQREEDLARRVARKRRTRARIPGDFQRLRDARYQRAELKR